MVMRTACGKAILLLVTSASVDCPSGSLTACLDVCPASIYAVCAKTCSDRCPTATPTATGPRGSTTTTVDWAANKRFKILKFKFKFPIARTFELLRARSRLYRSQILQHLQMFAEFSRKLLEKGTVKVRKLKQVRKYWEFELKL